jgi:4-amino-4-deoxy-L-arabinose transferase-like glycosyltransferase
VILTGMLGGLAVAVGAALIRVPGTTRRQTQPVLQAYATFRSRQEGSRVMWPAVGSAAACFAWLIMMNRGDRDSVPPAVILRMAAVSVLVGAVVAVVAWLRRRSQRRAQVGPAEVSGERCRCWETDLVVGRHWNRYLADHLVEVASDDGLNATLRRCPTTEKVWLHLPERDVAVSVRLPAEPEPEPDRPIGLYL